jgi:hypothetical protein
MNAAKCSYSKGEIMSQDTKAAPEIDRVVKMLADLKLVKTQLATSGGVELTVVVPKESFTQSVKESMAQIMHHAM